jgi:molecular chaperone DnaK
VHTSRATERKLVGLLVKLAYKGLDEFASKYASNLSDGGMFVCMREPKPVGTELSFKVEIGNGQRVLQGIAVVRWIRSDGEPGGPSGMGLEFLTLDPASRALVDRMVGKAAPIETPRPPTVAPVIAPAVPSAAVRVAAQELFGDDVPVVVPAKRPPPASAVPQGAEPQPELDDGGFDIPLEGDQVFSGSSASGIAIDVDLDALVDATPAPDDFLAPPPPPPADADLEHIELAPPPSAGVPLEPVRPERSRQTPRPSTQLGATGAGQTKHDDGAERLADLPPLARGSTRPQPAPGPRPVLEEQRAMPPPPPPQLQVKPVFLQDVKAGAATGPVIGIDLGTTNSAVAVLTKGRPFILSSKDGYNTIPSIVSLSAQGKVQIGHRAKAQMVLNPTRSIFGAKRLVGRDFDSPTVKQLKERSHFEIVAGADHRAAVRLGEKVLSLEEVQGLVLKECREMAEQALGVPVSRAVITCPAYYSEPQREAVRRAGAMAGLKVERVLNEPTAAALAYGMNRELKKTVLVYDLGGGTFDATLLKVDQNVFEVLATGGDVFLGGTDFDAQIVDLLLRRFQEWHKQPFAGDRVALSRVTEAAEKAKMVLSESATFEVSLPMLEMSAAGKPLDLRTTLTRADVEAACAELVDRTLQAVHDVLLDAKLKASQVDEVILVGGMSRMPLVREKLKTIFKKPPHASVNADEAVALGAALYTGTVDKVSSLVLIDVVPMTIGLGRPGGVFHRLIERNTPLPASKSFGITTQKDNETELEVMVFQGEDSNVAGNEFVGAITINGLPKGPRGSVQVALTLGLDAECVLRVEAREFKTRTVVRSTLATRYTTEEIAARLGISAEKQAAVNQSRAAELEKRAGGFWGKLKGLFRR